MTATDSLPGILLPGRLFSSTRTVTHKHCVHMLRRHLTPPQKWSYATETAPYATGINIVCHPAWHRTPIAQHRPSTHGAEVRQNEQPNEKLSTLLRLSSTVSDEAPFCSTIALETLVNPTS